MKFSDHPQRDDMVRALSDWAASHPEITSVIVYGSRARGDHRPDSDLDIALELRGDATGTAFAIWLDEKDAWAEELRSLLPWPLHLEWHDLQGSTPKVAGKLARGNYRAYEIIV